MRGVSHFTQGGDDGASGGHVGRSILADPGKPVMPKPRGPVPEMNLDVLYGTLAILDEGYEDLGKSGRIDVGYLLRYSQEMVLLGGAELVLRVLIGRYVVARLRMELEPSGAIEVLAWEAWRRRHVVRRFYNAAAEVSVASAFETYRERIGESARAILEEWFEFAHRDLLVADERAADARHDGEVV